MVGSAGEKVEVQVVAVPTIEMRIVISSSCERS